MKSLYRQFLRLPRFKGKSRIEGVWRGMWLKPRSQRIIHGLRMDLDPREWLQTDILARGVIEPGTTSLLGELLRPGDTYVDVGAHVGLLTLIARHHIGETGKVIAFEPQPYACFKILQNWRCNGFSNLSLHVAAVSDSNAVVRLHDQADTDHSRLTLCGAGVNDLPLRYQVPCVRLDTTLAAEDVAHVRVLKIDVEGYEQPVLRGLGEYAAKTDHIILEILPDSPSTDAVLKTLGEFGFTQLRTVDGASWRAGTDLPENNLLASRPGI